ncbi:hypothetical protein CYLTODRAFT_417675 [Cylindrobasidium torrendii FP15055 ss-10]|uniref:Carbohydrate-binding module family 13 protein n=1 Tax=Cylindrobasidium torrendii FP15055 ss-10 TaxID=1314674 RepID=A0A0D7BSS6_9AGAR|nr:hypothetical protein CYLTODRAFT_417675 [Cylindrobasidium torrendii FP15055 ss-10]
MLSFSSLLLSSVLLASDIALGQYSATYTPGDLPETSEEGQSGTNRCGDGFNQTSSCQTAYINGIDDFCLWAPPEPGPESVVGNTERIEVAWCTKEGYGTRIIPNGAIGGAHFVKTPDFVQITGVGNLTLLNIPAGDAGGELDPHGADGNGNPIGGLVFSNAFGQMQQIHEWTNFMSAEQFCFRACNPGGSDPAAFCQHIYDVMGCAWNMPASYDANVFESCDGASGEPMGVYGGSTFHQGEGATPPPHPAPSSSNCKSTASLSNTLIISGTSVGTAASTTKSATSTSTRSGSSGVSGAQNDGASGSASSTATPDGALSVKNLNQIGFSIAAMLGCALFGAMMTF